MLIGDFHVNAALEHARVLGQRPGYFDPAAVRLAVERRGKPRVARRRDPAPAAGGVLPDALVGRGRHRRHARSASARRSARSTRDVQRRRVEPDESCTHHVRRDRPAPRSRASPTASCPGIIARHRARDRRPVSVSTARALSPRCDGWPREHGLFVGPSSGAHLVAASACASSTPSSRRSSPSSATRARSTSPTTTRRPPRLT